MEETNQPKRAASTSIQDCRQVKAALADVATGLTKLQREAAFLSAMASHERRGVDEGHRSGNTSPRCKENSTAPSRAFLNTFERTAE